MPFIVYCQWILNNVFFHYCFANTLQKMLLFVLLISKTYSKEQRAKSKKQRKRIEGLCLVKSIQAKTCRSHDSAWIILVIPKPKAIQFKHKSRSRCLLLHFTISQIDHGIYENKVEPINGFLLITFFWCNIVQWICSKNYKLIQ